MNVAPFRPTAAYWIAVGPILRVKKGRGQRKNRRDRAGRVKHSLITRFGAAWERGQRNAIRAALYGILKPCLP